MQAAPNSNKNLFLKRVQFAKSLLLFLLRRTHVLAVVLGLRSTGNGGFLAISFGVVHLRGRRSGRSLWPTGLRYGGLLRSRVLNGRRWFRRSCRWLRAGSLGRGCLRP